MVRRDDAGAAGGARRAAAADAGARRSPPTAPTACRATTGCAGCATSCAAAASSRSSRWSRSTATDVAELLARAAARAALPVAGADGPRPHAWARPSSSRSWSRRCRCGTPCARAGAGSSWPSDDEVPVPDTVREAVLVGISELSAEAREAAEAAAVVGQQFDLALAAELASDAGLAELVEAGLLEEQAIRARPPSATRWRRRRSTPRCPGCGAATSTAARRGARGARRLQPRDRRPTGSAPATRPAPARRWSRAARESEALHAHRDATRAAREALELWPEDEAEELRTETLERYGALRRAGRRARRGDESLARAGRRAATARGDGLGYARGAAPPGRGLRARRRTRRRPSPPAASPPRPSPPPGSPPTPRWSGWRWPTTTARGARYGEAIELAELAAADARAARADRPRRPRRSACRASSQAKGGDFEQGLESVRAGLALALEHDLTPVAAELYQRLSLVLYDGADYRQAEEALDTALDLCRTDGDAGTEVACVTCLVYVLRERGEWSRAAELGRELIESDTAVWVAEGLLGAIHAFQGKLGSARRMLTASRAVSSSVGHYNMYVDSTTCAGDRRRRRRARRRGGRATAASCSPAGKRARTTTTRSGECAGRRAGSPSSGDARTPSSAPRRWARWPPRAATTTPLAALAQAVGELALLEGDAAGAAEQPLPRGRAAPQPGDPARAGPGRTARRRRPRRRRRARGGAGAALRRLPLRRQARRPPARRRRRRKRWRRLGESVAQRLGSRAAAAADGVQLTRRELEVLRHVAVGRTNREIAQELFISQRTVDMHVRNLLGKLDCRSRVEASHRAGELGLLELDDLFETSGFPISPVRVGPEMPDYSTSPLRDWGELISFTPSTVLQPTSVEELKEILEKVHRGELGDGRVRVPGSLHSCSEIAVGDAIVDVSSLPKSIELEDGDGGGDRDGQRLPARVPRRARPPRQIGHRDRRHRPPDPGRADLDRHRAGQLPPRRSTRSSSGSSSSPSTPPARRSSGASPAATPTSRRWSARSACSASSPGSASASSTSSIFDVTMKVVELDDVLADLDATSAQYDFWRVNWMQKSDKALLWAATAVPREHVEARRRLPRGTLRADARLRLRGDGQDRRHRAAAEPGRSR